VMACEAIPPNLTRHTAQNHKKRLRPGRKPD
jgi:hypothetical protein